MRETWDGKTIASEPPYGATIVVYRINSAGMEFLLLHRAHHGSDYAGDWAWTPPSGARQPGETVEQCAARELYEEAGIKAEMQQVDGGPTDWAVFYTEVATDTQVVLHDDEHDTYKWVSLPEALKRCRPQKVAAGIARATRAIAGV